MRCGVVYLPSCRQGNIYLNIYLSIHLSIQLPIHVFTRPPIHLPIYLVPINQSKYTNQHIVAAVVTGSLETSLKLINPHPYPPALDRGLLNVVNALRVCHTLHQPFHVPAAHDSVRPEPKAKPFPLEDVVHQSNNLRRATRAQGGRGVIVIHTWPWSVAPWTTVV